MFNALEGVQGVYVVGYSPHRRHQPSQAAADGGNPPGLFFLKMPLSDQRANAINTFIRAPDHRARGTATISFIGWGMWESDEQEQSVMPLLETLAGNLQRSCNGG